MKIIYILLASLFLFAGCANRDAGYLEHYSIDPNGQGFTLTTPAETQQQWEAAKKMVHEVVNPKDFPAGITNCQIGDTAQGRATLHRGYVDTYMVETTSRNCEPINTNPNVNVGDTP